jgi:hypothetical protein
MRPMQQTPWLRSLRERRTPRRRATASGERRPESRLPQSPRSRRSEDQPSRSRPLRQTRRVELLRTHQTPPLPWRQSADRARGSVCICSRSRLRRSHLKRTWANWRRGRDLNPGWACTHNGFQDRRHQPDSATPPWAPRILETRQRTPIRSRPPMYGRSTSGTLIVPSTRW